MATDPEPLKFRLMSDAIRDSAKAEDDAYEKGWRAAASTIEAALQYKSGQAFSSWAAAAAIARDHAHLPAERVEPAVSPGPFGIRVYVSPNMPDDVVALVSYTKEGGFNVVKLVNIKPEETK